MTLACDLWKEYWVLYSKLSPAAYCAVWVLLPEPDYCKLTLLQFQSRDRLVVLINIIFGSWSPRFIYVIRLPQLVQMTFIIKFICNVIRSKAMRTDDLMLSVSITLPVWSKGALFTLLAVLLLMWILNKHHFMVLSTF